MIELLSVGPKQDDNGWPAYLAMDPLREEFQEVPHFGEQPVGFVTSYYELRDLADEHGITLEHISGLEQMVKELGEVENELGPMSGRIGRR